MDNMAAALPGSDPLQLAFLPRLAQGGVLDHILRNVSAPIETSTASC